VNNSYFKATTTVDRHDYHVNQKHVEQHLHTHKAVHIDHQNFYTIDSSRLAAIERRLAALEG